MQSMRERLADAKRAHEEVGLEVVVLEGDRATAITTIQGIEKAIKTLEEERQKAEAGVEAKRQAYEAAAAKYGHYLRRNTMFKERIWRGEGGNKERSKSI